MNLASVSEILNSLEDVVTLMTRWGLTAGDWCLLDGPAIKLHNNQFDATPWRNHLNIYVLEESLPWHTEALELTVPPLGSPELRDMLQTARRGTDIHLVPASRYYKAGFEHEPISLASGRRAEAATLRGCSQIWSYKSAETVTNVKEFAGDIERIVQERLLRLNIALTAAKEDDIHERLILLKEGYEALGQRKMTRAKRAFLKAAGLAWAKIN